MTKPGTYQPNYIRQWRQHRGLTIGNVAERTHLSQSLLSMVERGRRAYTQLTLEAVASALRTDTASLLMRAPTDPDDIGTMWDKAKPGQRKQITEMARKLVKGRR